MAAFKKFYKAVDRTTIPDTTTPILSICFLLMIYGGKEDIDRQQREKIILAFARNALPFRLIDDGAFLAAFGMQIPRKVNRNELASGTETLRESVELTLLRR